ncbi:hypothetical protein M3148_09535 [Georgenia satyanarayanai]|uniref:hypothetical protein n=1 Tax=Georgenia satyanarayanai TaxID=860221 RepID=UPI0020408C29|nr:hypothetical protein [Georgenia satyanarayanai]MCM3661230.1 hypothetical protein [Georgenia satyanarayanai]
MGRATAGAAGVVLLGALVTGCSGDDVDPSEVSAWMNAEERAVESGLGQMSSRVGPGDGPAQPGNGITVDFEAPLQVAGVRLSCFGEDTLTFLVEVTRDTGGLSQTTGVEHDVACGEGAQLAEVPEPKVTAVRVDAYGAEHDGAWHAVILGQ